MNPLGDSCGSDAPLFIFNLVDDKLYYSDSVQNLSASLSICKTPNDVVTLQDLDPWEPPIPREPNLAGFASSTWDPPRLIGDQTLSIVSRMLTDFNHL